MCAEYKLASVTMMLSPTDGTPSSALELDAFFENGIGGEEGEGEEEEVHDIGGSLDSVESLSKGSSKRSGKYNRQHPLPTYISLPFCSVTCISFQLIPSHPISDLIYLPPLLPPSLPYSSLMPPLCLPH